MSYSHGSRKFRLPLCGPYHESLFPRRTRDLQRLMGLWVLDDNHLDHVPGTVPLAEVSNIDIEGANGIPYFGPR